MTAIRVLSYNIHKGFTAGRRRFVLARMRDAIRELDPELVFLQEVQGEHHHRARHHAEWPVTGQGEFLAEGVWTHHAYGRNFVSAVAHHGNAILSKHPFSSWENIDVSNNRFERRGLLHATVAHPSAPSGLHLICCHLDLFEHGRSRQIERLVERIAAHVPADAPLLVAGDFNDWRERVSAVLAQRLGLVEVHSAVHGAHARSFPVWFPLLALDRLYCRGLTPRSAACLSGQPWRKLSDHAALVAELE